MKNIKKKDIFVFILFFIIVFSVFYFYNVFVADEMWTYGFSYNITKGLVPYLDYNMVILPFHSIFIALPMMIFGNSLLMWHLICAFILSLCLLLFYRKIGLSKTLFLIIAMTSFDSYSYNTFITVGVALILLLEKSEYKYKDLIIGLLIGSIMMTKANIGAFLFLVYFFKSKEKLKMFLYAAIIPFMTLIYLIISGSLLACIDYCFLGMKNFSNNAIVDYACLGGIILYIIYIIYKIRVTKDKNYYYLLVYIMMCYPICDYNHFPIMLWPLLFYLFLTLKKKDNIMIVKALLVTLAICSLKIFSLDYNTLNSKFFGIRRINYGDRITEYSSYLKEHKEENIFVFEFYAYMVKMDADVPITKYDLLNRGNMGSDEKLFLKEIDNICKKEGCRILTDFYEIKMPYAQFNKDYYNYVKNNFELCDKDFVYCMKKVSCESIEDK